MYPRVGQSWAWWQPFVPIGTDDADYMSAQDIHDPQWMQDIVEKSMYK
jgi:hypothetical protein